MRTLLTNATLIDCVQPRAVEGAAVLIENGRIREIRTDGSAPAAGGATAIDLRGAYLMPGLWDVHIHPDYYLPTEMPLADQVTLFGHRLMAALTESGITGLRCAGAHHYMDVAWKRAFDSGQYVGPRLFACGHFLTTTGGHFLTSGHALECDGPYGFVKAIREQIKNGVDHIKLNLSGGIMGPAWDLHRHSFLLQDELKAAFEICRLREFKVMAHATNPEAVKNAIRLGAHSVEHGYILDDECIELFLKHDTWYVPTLAISHLTPDQANNDWEQRWVRQRNLAHALCCRADAAVGRASRRVRARRSRPASRWRWAPTSGRSRMPRCSRWDCGSATAPRRGRRCVAATRNGAAVCGVGDELGTVEVGKLADLIVVGGNPLEDIHNVRQLQLVLKEGVVVSDKRE